MKKADLLIRRYLDNLYMLKYKIPQIVTLTQIKGVSPSEYVLL